MNDKYLNKLFTKLKKDDKEEFEITNKEDLKEYIEMVISSNFQYDFGIDIDVKELLY